MESRPNLRWDQLVHRYILWLFPQFLNWNKHVYESHCCRKANPLYQISKREANCIPVETVDMSATIKDSKHAGMLLPITPAFNILLGLCRSWMDSGKWLDFQVGRHHRERMGFCLLACSICFESETIMWCCLLHNQNLEIKGWKWEWLLSQLIPNNPLTGFCLLFQLLWALLVWRSLFLMGNTNTTIVPLN